MVETEGLTHVQLVVRDVHRALAFYQRVFGMEIQHWDGDDMVFLRTPGRRDTLTLSGGDPHRAGAPGGVDHIGFRLVDKSALDHAIDEVVAAGGRLIELGENPPGRRYAYVADCDGYVIEL